MVGKLFSYTQSKGEQDVAKNEFLYTYKPHMSGNTVQI